MIKRNFSKNQIELLKKEKLFTDFLLPDIQEKKSHNEKNRDVFPAIRDGKIDFYHRGGKLFSYEGKKGFTTHLKYASVLTGAGKKDYVKESDLPSLHSIKSFTDTQVYDRIKENCAVYAGIEAVAVSQVYNMFSFAKSKRSKSIVVLDIEISFKQEDMDEPSSDRERIKRDRIDFVLMNIETQELKFYEAKIFSNNEIRAVGTPKVIGQLERYRKQLANKTEILNQYANYVEAVNELFECNLPAPEQIDPEPCLFICGFDDDQKRGRLKQEIKKLREQGAQVYAIGNPGEVKIEPLWQCK